MAKELKAREVYEKFSKGDSLTDAEVRFGMSFYRELASKLIKCGPVFHLAWVEANRVAYAFEGFHQARQRAR